MPDQLTGTAAHGGVRVTERDRDRAEKLIMTLLDQSCEWGAAEKLHIVASALAAERARACEVGAELVRRAENFWAYLQGEHGVTLGSADEDDHNVYGFFSAVEKGRAAFAQQYDAEGQGGQGEPK